MLICDTSGLLAYFDRSDRQHEAVAAAVEGDPGPFVVSPYVVAELDYLLATQRGVAAELAALAELSGGAWKLAASDQPDLGTATGIVERYADQAIGVADASLVVLAHRYHTDRLLTLDRRHFAVVRTIAGRPFTLLPAE
ncbi:MAG TPA: PIN domain-containing protein [Candidatus Deferrimicrobium sp.]|nr:PIN domain-containing protein [Candidatus Deferrimicrobium sp.]